MAPGPPAGEAGVDVVVVGAGLAGLTAATTLAGRGLTVSVLEARHRLGGRLLSGPAGASGRPSFDLGATWHWADQPRVATLAADLGLTVFPQPTAGRGVWEAAGAAPQAVAFPAPPAAALRFAEGTAALCARLGDTLPPGAVRLGMRATAVVDAGDGVRVEVAGGQAVSARAAVVALPPRLAALTIGFDPPLPARLAELMASTPTWMSGALKCLVVYPGPFWRDRGLSGSALSERGPLVEVHDASPPDGAVGAVWALVAPDPHVRALDPDGRREAVVRHLEVLFGPGPPPPLDYVECDWSADPLTAGTALDPGADPATYGHPLFGQPLWDGRLLLAGAETSAEGGGHMEGAVRSGQRAAWLILAASGEGR